MEEDPTTANRTRQSISALAAWVGCSIGRLAGLGVDLDGIAGQITGGGERMFGMVGQIGGTATTGTTTTGGGMEMTTTGIETIAATTGTIPAGVSVTTVAAIGEIVASTMEAAGMAEAATEVIMVAAGMAAATGKAFEVQV